MLRNLAAIMIRPRQVMARILAAPERVWIAIIVLATISAMVGDFDPNGFNNLRRAAASSDIHPALIAAIGAGVFVATFLAAFLFFFIFSWGVWGLGNLMDGAGDARAVRRAVAWGLTPVVWALVYRVPAMFLTRFVSPELRASSTKLTLDPGRLGGGCLISVVFAALELAMVVWCVTVMSNTVGEAHRFSSWRGLATLLLTSIAPLIITIAAVLAM